MVYFAGKRGLVLIIGIFLFLAAWGPQGGSPAAAAEQVTMGVLTYRPADVTQQRWQPLADYLNETVKGLNIELRALNFPALEEAIARSEIDFVLTNPAHYVQLSQRDQLSSPLATMINLVDGTPARNFGGVLLVPDHREDLRRPADLKNQVVATVSLQSLGGFQAQALELRNHDIDVFRDVTLLETGMPHDAAAYALVNGEADAAFVRTGVLEALVSEGRLEPRAVRVLNPQSRQDFPFALSTAIYPEWSLAALVHSDEQMALDVAAAIFSLPHGGEIAARTGIHGFTVPADYRPVEQLLRDLRLPPFDQSPAFTLGDAWERWQWQLISGLLAIFLLLMLVTGLVYARRRVQRERAYILNLLAGLGEGVFGTDMKGRCTFVNDTALSMLGFTADEVIGADHHRLFHHQTVDGGDYPETECPVYLTKRDDRVRRQEEWFLRKDGTGFPVELVVTPLRDEGETRGAIVAFQDLSQSRETKQRLSRKKQELNRTSSDLEQFVCAASHDLRQPLRMVKGHLQMLKRSLADRLSENEQNYLFYALDGAGKMDEMILGLLKYSRVGRKSEPKAFLATRDVVNDALNFLDPEIKKSGADIKIDGTWPQVLASRDELIRLFQNLLGNAIKYVPPGTVPKIEVESQVAVGRWWVEIRDNGIGVDPESQSSLFKLFSRPHLPQQFEVEGTGIGLALCCKIVEHHGGTIGVESAGHGQGSTFWFEMPVNRSAD